MRPQSEIHSKGTKTITTTIPLDIWESAKEENLKIPYLITRGWEVIHGEPQLLKRIHELEKAVEILEARFRRAEGRQDEREEKIESRLALCELKLFGGDDEGISTRR